MDESDMIEVDTKGLCLLCLKPYSSSTHKMSSVTAGGSSPAFKTLLRHLNVSTPELFNCSSLFFQSMNMKENINLQVSLCIDCSTITTKFDELYKNLEIIRLQMDNCLYSVALSMMDGDHCEERIREYRKRMQPVKKGDVINASIATNLRQETIKRCCSKINSSVPRVSVAKIGINPKPKPTDPDLVDRTQMEPVNGHEEFDTSKDTEILENGVNDDAQLSIEIQSCYSLAAPQPSTIAPLVLISELKLQEIKLGNETNCEYCAAKFTRPDHLYTHVFSQHVDNLLAEDLPPNTSTHACQFALDTILSAMLLNTTSKPMFECEFCHVKYSERNRIKFIIHLVTTHTSLVISRLNHLLPMQPIACEVNGHTTDPTLHSTVDLSLPPIPPVILVKQSSQSKRATARKKYAIKQLTNLTKAPKFQPKQCPLCSKHFPSTLSLNKHLRSHYRPPAAENSINRCRYCPLVITRSCRLTLHMLEVHPHREIHRLFPQTTSLDQCLSVVQTILQELKHRNGCGYCGKRWMTRNRKRHIIAAHFYTEFMDDVKTRMGIDTPLSNGNQIQTKEPTVSLKPVRKKFNCGKCGLYGFTRHKAQFDKHVLTCRGQKGVIQNNNKCDFCSKMLQSKLVLRRHLVENHLSQQLVKELHLPNSDGSWEDYINLTTTTLFREIRLNGKGQHCPYCKVDVKYFKRHVLLSHYDLFVNEIKSRLELEGDKGVDTYDEKCTEEVKLSQKPHVFIKDE